MNGPIVFSVSGLAARTAALEAIGLPTPAAVNMSVLPQSIGPITSFNAEGRYNVRKDLPKETAYRQIEWTWEQWSGRDTETMSKIVEVPYKRYPREFVPPPGVELSVLTTLDDELVLASPPVDLFGTEPELVCHNINIFLEAFGECEARREDLSRIVRAPVKRLNWRALPPGQRPWQELEPDLTEIIERQPEGNRAPLKFRLKHINDKRPDFVAIGSGGFRDYVVFGFTVRGLFILESPMMDNATYVFGGNWEQLAQMTKTDLITGNLAAARLIHRNSWKVKVNELFL